jgi:hypothetical protein
LGSWDPSIRVSVCIYVLGFWPCVHCPREYKPTSSWFSSKLSVPSYHLTTVCVVCLVIISKPVNCHHSTIIPVSFFAGISVFPFLQVYPPFLAQLSKNVPFSDQKNVRLMKKRGW